MKKTNPTDPVYPLIAPVLPDGSPAFESKTGITKREEFAKVALAATQGMHPFEAAMWAVKTADYLIEFLNGGPVEIPEELKEKLKNNG